MNNTITKMKTIIKKFISDKKGADDKNAGSAMSIVFSVVLGGLLITSIYAFFNEQFLPTVFGKIMDMFSLIK